MSFGEAIGSCYRNYFRLRGTATRPEYWWFTLYYFLLVTVGVCGILLAATYTRAVVDPVAAGAAPDRPMIYLGFVLLFIAILPLLASLVSVIPLVTAQVRRLHDAGQSGWWVVLLFILQTLNALYSRIEKIDHATSVVVVHVVLAFAQLGIGALIFFFLVQPSSRSGKYDFY